MTLQSVDKFFCAYCDFYGTDNAVLAHAQKEHREKISRPLVGHSSVQTAAPQTNREAHEEAAGMGLCPEFFTFDNIDPDAPFAQAIAAYDCAVLEGRATEERLIAELSEMRRKWHNETQTAASLRSQLEEAQRVCHHSDVYFSAESNNYYCGKCKRGMGNAYFAVAKRAEAAEQSLSTLQSRVVEDCCKAVCPFCHEGMAVDEHGLTHIQPSGRIAFQCKSWAIRSKYPSGAKE